MRVSPHALLPLQQLGFDTVGLRYRTPRHVRQKMRLALAWDGFHNPENRPAAICST